MALALRTLCGLSTREIARAFLETEATTAQRLVRAKRKILDARIPYEVPSREQLPERLQAVLGVVYLVFNEGYASTEHDGLVRPDLCAEAIRLARLLVELMPERAGGARPARADAAARCAARHARRRRRGAGAARGAGSQPLAARPRSPKASTMLDAALAQRRRGPYQLQAAIAALHARARRADETDWQQIAALYGGLLAEQPGAVVELNAAVALAMAEGPAARAGLDRPARAGATSCAGYHLLPAARADLLRRLGGRAKRRLPTRPRSRSTRNPRRAPVPRAAARRVQGLNPTGAAVRSLAGGGLCRHNRRR